MSSTIRPHRIGILVLPDFSHLTLAAVIEPMRVVNKITKRTLYEWSLLGSGTLNITASNGIPIQAERHILDAGEFDTLFVVASFNVISHTTKPVMQFIRKISRLGALICGFESGTYALAASGVLDGYRATTHWEDLDDFQERFPNVEGVRDRFVIDRKRCTTGGALPALDFVLDMIIREHGLALGITVSGTFIYDHNRPASDPQHIVSTARLAYRDRKVARAVSLMEAELKNRLNVSAIAKIVGLSSRGLQRRFQASLGRSPSRFYSELRLGLAYRLLEQSDRSITDIALTCGFASSSAFARAFRSKYHRSPSSIRDQKRSKPLS